MTYRDAVVITVTIWVTVALVAFGYWIGGKIR